MSEFLHALSIIIAILYLVLTYEYGHLFYSEHSRESRNAGRLLLGVVILQLLHYLTKGVISGQWPFATFYDLMGAIGLALALVYLVLETRLHVQVTGVFVMALAFLFQLVPASVLHTGVPAHNLEQNNWLDYHILTAVFGCAAVTIAALYGLLYLLLRRNLRLNRFGRLYSKLPPLESLAMMNYFSAVLGFIVLTLSLVIGVWLALQADAATWISDAKIYVTVVMWVAMGCIVGIRVIGQWRPKWNAWCALIGFTCMIIGIVLINMLMTGYHTFS